ncbi:unnamed protein product [Rhizoctonia solani]|uniref:Extracellular membrane protein CFEM domain-containing protein n=1 Tax=Rhizoctonia solani TaxID=456999 RepID=A0A8H3AZF6_9AGAM|nr:unnamed protein product [Rhizoctonia solani]CAE6444071.1 unnamed protein product [Rhizoctonia solani]
MRAFTIISALVAVAFSGVFATPGDAVSTLFARQNSAVPEIPAECKAKCTSIQAITACGTDLACMCSNEMGQGIVDCGNCGIDYHKSDPNINTYKNQFQTSVNSYADSCTQAGHPIGPFSVTGSSVSGGSGSGSSPTKAASGTTPTGSASNSTSSNGALSFHAAAGTGALAAVAVVMASVL